MRGLMSNREFIFAIGLCVLMVESSHAEPQQTKPTIALLEFLADFSDEDGSWVDPIEFEEIELPVSGDEE